MKRNIKIFRGMERSWVEVWSFVRIHVSLLALVVKCWKSKWMQRPGVAKACARNWFSGS